jgi:hypothetical protein
MGTMKNGCEQESEKKINKGSDYHQVSNLVSSFLSVAFKINHSIPNQRFFYFEE